MNTLRDRLGLVFGSALTSNERLVLIAWLSHASPEGVAWPSIDRLALLTGLGERTVRRALKVLRECGVLETLGRHKKGSLRLRFAGCPQRSDGPRPLGALPSGPREQRAPATVTDKRRSENEDQGTKPYPYPFPCGEGDPDQARFILEWAREVGADADWWELAAAGDPGVVHQVHRAMERSKKAGGYRGSMRYRWVRGSIQRAWAELDSGGVLESG